MNDRISAIVTAESAPDGTLVLFVRAVDGARGFRLNRATLELALWLVDADVVRLSMQNPATGTIAYLQGAGPALDLVRELGLQLGG